MPDDNIPPPEQLQFRRAQSIADPAMRVCIACKQEISGEYYDANGNILCPSCTQRIRTGQQSPPPVSMLRAALFGAGAALGGSILYAAVSAYLKAQFGIIAILIGYMVGKAVRFASGGGRPQQILSVALTYFAITGAFILGIVYQASKSGQSIDFNHALVPLLELAVAAPFLALFQGSNSISALISLVIIFFGLRQAWALTATSKIVITGPFMQ